jgi:hypothetical protein
VELRDHRYPNRGSVVPQTSPNKVGPISSVRNLESCKIALRPTNGTLITDLDLMNEAFGGEWNDHLALSVEANVLVRCDLRVCSSRCA